MKMRDLNPKDINHLVSIKGIVIRCSDIYPEMTQAVFKCTSCDQIERSDRLLAGQDRSSFCEQTVKPIEWCSESPSPTEWQIPQHAGSKLAVLRVIQDIQGRCSR